MGVINWSIEWFIIGCITASAIKLATLYEETESQNNKIHEENSAPEHRNKTNTTTLLYYLLHSLFGGFFVMILNPNNIITAVVIGAAWDKILLRTIKKYGEQLKE